MIHEEQEQKKENFAVLNSLALFDRARSFLERHRQINLYLDNDEAGRSLSELVIAINKKYKDRSERYRNYKDINEWLLHREVIAS